MTSGILIRPEDVYHFTLILPSKQIPFTLSHFLESLEPTKYRGEIKHVEAKIDKGEYKERDGTPVVGKRLCTKVNSLLQDFSVIRGKLEAQRAFASRRSVSRERRPPGPSQGSVDTAGASPASSKAKPKRPSASGGERPTRKCPLASSSGRQFAGATSQVSEVAEASLVAPLASASSLVHSSQWRKPHGSLLPCTRKGHDAPTQHGPHPCKVSPQPLVSPIQTRDLSSKSPCSPLSR